MTFCDCGQVDMPIGAWSVQVVGETTEHTETACIGGQR